MSTSPRMSFRVPFEATMFRAVRKTIESYAADRGFSDGKVSDVSLAVCEALFNAMEHGKPVDSAVGVDVSCDDGILEVSIENDSAADAEACFSELQAALAELGDLPDTELERGRGLFLIREKTDEVRVERSAGGGVRLVMVKRR